MTKITDVISKPFQPASDDNPSDSLRNRKRYMAARLQALGYLSLASLVAEKNGYGTQFAPLGTHASNMAQFKALLLDENQWYLTQGQEGGDVILPNPSHLWHLRWICVWQ